MILLNMLLDGSKFNCINESSKDDELSTSPLTLRDTFDLQGPVKLLGPTMNCPLGTTIFA